MTDVTINIGGIRIGSAALYRRYFDFPQVFWLLKEKPSRFRAFVTRAFSLLAAYDLFGGFDVRGNPQGGTPVCLLHEPMRCLEYEDWIFTEGENDGCVTLQAENLWVHLTEKYRRYLEDPESREKNIYAGCPSPEQMKAGLRRSIDRLTEQGRRQFSHEGAVELYLFFLLTVQAGLLVEEHSGQVKNLQIHLENANPLSQWTLAGQRMIHFTDSLELPYYTGAKENGSRMEIVQIYNCGKSAGRVALAGTVLFRVVLPGSSVFALRKDGEYLSFLPRMALVGDTVMRLENGRLCMAVEKETRYIDTEIATPACWAHSNEYGTFILDGDGNLDPDHAWPREIPAKCVKVSAYGERYGILCPDGRVLGWPLQDRWKGILDFHIGRNSAVALDAARRPIGQDGNRLDEVQAAEIYSLDSHYIWMSADGEIGTDSGLLLPSPVLAIAICPEGYLVAGKEMVALYSFQNQFIKSWDAKGVSELSASDTILCWFQSSDGRIVVQRL